MKLKKGEDEDEGRDEENGRGKLSLSHRILMEHHKSASGNRLMHPAHKQTYKAAVRPDETPDDQREDGEGSSQKRRRDEAAKVSAAGKKRIIT